MPSVHLTLVRVIHGSQKSSPRQSLFCLSTVCPSLVVIKQFIRSLRRLWRRTEGCSACLCLQTGWSVRGSKWVAFILHFNVLLSECTVKLVIDGHITQRWSAVWSEHLTALITHGCRRKLLWYSVPRVHSQCVTCQHMHRSKCCTPAGRPMDLMLCDECL